jgi:hypothetical protein
LSGKDANLIRSSPVKPMPLGLALPSRNRCARGAPRVPLRVGALRCASRLNVATFCVLHFAFCGLAVAQFPMRAVDARPVDPAVQPAQFAPPSLPYPQGVVPPGPAVPQQPSFRRVQIFPRSDVGPQAEWLTTPQGENVLVVSGGVNVVVQGVSVEGLPEMFGPLGNVDIETDRAVIWTRGVNTGQLGELTQQGELPLEIYMEGNIVFRQGDRTVYADRMFYDVRRQLGVVLNAELLTPLPAMGGYQYQGLVRLKAAALRQLDQSHFVAQNGLVTTSRLEEPSYAFGSDVITFEDVQQTVIDPYTGQPVVNPWTGASEVAHRRLARSENNFLYVAGVPVLYWPTMATDLEKTSYYVDNLRLRNDSTFGFQTLLELDAFQLLGIADRPQGVEWDLNLDYLSQRGLGYGTSVEYDRDSFFGLVGPTSGWADLWAIKDHGLDNLGFARRAIVPEETFRGRAFWDHRQQLVGGWLDDWTVQGEVGWISDRTFLEQYYEHEWDDNRDQLTGARLKRTYDNQAISFEANGRINEFFTQTQWLPRGDHYWLGQPLLSDSLTWFEHSQAAYANIGLASMPTNPTLAGQWSLLPWEVDSVGNRISGKGERLVTRQEIDVPIDVAPFKFVPYALGELGHWGQDIDGDPIDRAYFQTGLRASIPFWTADPTIRDRLFNLNGLAHKVVFDAEVSYADANRNMTEFPLYDSLDDEAIVELHRRLFYAPFNGGLAPYYTPGAIPTIDPKFDPRYYALRSGIQGWVTSPVTEIADDLTIMRLGMHHRLQTKRGPAGEERIIDWLTLSSNITWFPMENRDNYGHDFGLMDYDMRWYLGDRFTVLSDGAADFFGDGLRTASLGVLLNRPLRGNAYLGFRTLDGPFSSNIVTAAVNYRMSPKWIGSGSTSIDITGNGNVSQGFSVSRIGESLIATVGAHVDESKNDIGFSFLVEPRFLPTLSVTRKTGIEIPPAGAYGLE